MINVNRLDIELSPVQDVLHVPNLPLFVPRFLLHFVDFQVVEVGSRSNKEADYHELDGCE